MKIVRGFGVLSMGKYLGVLYGMLGLLIGVIYGGVLMIIGAIGAASDSADAGPLAAMGMAGGIGVMIFSPILYGIMGFIFGMIGTLLANLALRFTGGLEVEMD